MDCSLYLNRNRTKKKNFYDPSSKISNPSVCIGDILYVKNVGESFQNKEKGVGLVRVSAPLPLGTYPYSTSVAVNTKRSLVERTASDEKVQPSRKKSHYICNYRSSRYVCRKKF